VSVSTIKISNHETIHALLRSCNHGCELEPNHPRRYLHERRRTSVYDHARRGLIWRRRERL